QGPEALSPQMDSLQSGLLLSGVCTHWPVAVSQRSIVHWSPSSQVGVTVSSFTHWPVDGLHESVVQASSSSHAGGGVLRHVPLAGSQESVVHELLSLQVEVTLSTFEH